MFRNVVFPEPERPWTTHSSCARMATDTSRSACTVCAARYSLVTPVRRTSGSVICHLRANRDVVGPEREPHAPLEREGVGVVARQLQAPRPGEPPQLLGHELLALEAPQGLRRR